MRLILKPDGKAVALEAARIVADTISTILDVAIGLPTGRTPVGMYDELVRLHREARLDFSRVRIFTLDEYIGIPQNDPRSFYSYMWTRLLGRANVTPENIHLHSSTATQASCSQYEADIRAAGGIELLVAGVGRNGHIAFNEPGSPLDSRTRLVDLAQSTLEGMRDEFGDQEQPKQAVTIGIGTILEARRVLLLVAGESKKAALSGLIHGPIQACNPVSALRTHSNLTVIADPAAVDTA